MKIRKISTKTKIDLNIHELILRGDKKIVKIRKIKNSICIGNRWKNSSSCNYMQEIYTAKLIAHTINVIYYVVCTTDNFVMQQKIIPEAKANI